VALDLDGCGIGDTGMDLLRDLVVANKRIHELDLQLNQISDCGAKALASAVPHSGLSILHLGNNTVTAVGTRALLEASVLQHRLTGRMMKLCGISESVMAAARQQLQEKASAPCRTQTSSLGGAQGEGPCTKAKQQEDRMLVEKVEST
jgi:Ran GTPase-activating protein (RanGAP) involved in mRNA processing and transport